eukprot:CAMPEP_0114520788 /NCGR_PEP_ID=MMETSP0109-20121206/19814_1 /TAXON_ID=29199 /ORGANISM="Chlorarachnion reptans, Strain CCCM449" /LENGTH=333 /DNA_ID=CAMNT_0001701799 /DNA_START=71 /DNA_END=1072 /DNA_ORIENTATION=+
MPRVSPNPFHLHADCGEMLHNAAIIAGNLSHECRNWLAQYATNDYPELQNIDALNGQIEGQVRDLAGHLVFGLGEHCKRVVTQISKKSKYVSRLLSTLDSDDLVEEIEFVRAANESQLKILSQIDQCMMLEFCGSPTESIKKGLREVSKKIEIGERKINENCVETSGVANSEQVPQAPKSVSVDYYVVPGFADYSDAKGASKASIARHLWNLARDASNTSHQIQNIATRYLVSKPHQPKINELINLAGQAENQARGSLRSLSQFGSRPYNPAQMNQQISRQVLNQINVVKQKVSDMEGKEFSGELSESLSKSFGALYAYVCSATIVASALVGK